MAQGTRFGMGNNQCDDKPVRKGCSLGMVNAGSTVLEKFQIAKDAGIEGLELTLPAAPETVKEYVEAIDKTGLPAAGIMFAGNWKSNLSDPDADLRKKAIAEITTALEQAREVRAPHVLVVPGVVNEAVDYETAWKNSLEGLRQLTDVAATNKVKIGIENVWNNFILSPMEMNYYLDLVNSPWVGALFDIGNILRYGWPAHWITALKHRIVNLHIKGYSVEKANKTGVWSGFGVEMTDEGDFDWKPVAAALKKINFKGWLIAEVGGGDAARVKDISNRLQKMVDLVGK